MKSIISRFQVYIMEIGRSVHQYCCNANIVGKRQSSVYFHLIISLYPYLYSFMSFITLLCSNLFVILLLQLDHLRGNKCVQERCLAPPWPSHYVLTLRHRTVKMGLVPNVLPMHSLLSVVINGQGY